jgi:hypothetical protein
MGIGDKTMLETDAITKLKELELFINNNGFFKATYLEHNTLLILEPDHRHDYFIHAKDLKKIVYNKNVIKIYNIYSNYIVLNYDKCSINIGI